MIKIPAYIIGGLLILTGLAGYLLQEPSLSIKITGPLAEDAQLTLSDGNQSHELDLGFASSNAAGEHAYWLIYNLNLNHAKDASQGNYAIEQGATDRGYVEKSFWYASTKGETMNALKQESNNFQGVGVDDTEEIIWSNVDQNASKIRFIFKNFVNSPGPITLQAKNWKNIDINPKPEPNEKVEFGTSWTAFIPGILGIILILLTLGADKFPKAHKHFMHVAVLVAFVCFFVVTKMLLDAYSEMTLLKEEPYNIIHISSLKPTVMLMSAGLLLIFVILCIVSFIEARKNRSDEEKQNTKSKISSQSTLGKNNTKSESSSEEESKIEGTKEDSDSLVKKESTISTDSKNEDKKTSNENLKERQLSSTKDNIKSDQKEPPSSKQITDTDKEDKKPFTPSGSSTASSSNEENSSDKEQDNSPKNKEVEEK